MERKKKLKMFLDILMTLSLLVVMAYQVTGSLYHEIFGAVMLVLFILHNMLNISWYRRIFKGKYGVVRIIWTIINLATLVAILITGLSGMAISKHFFTALHLSMGPVPARTLHLAESYWSFVLMSCHLGLHGSLVTAVIHKHMKRPAALWFLRTVGIALAVFGAIRFYQQDIYSYMFLKNQFAFLDYDKAAVLVLLDNMAEMFAFVSIIYSSMRGILMLTASGRDVRKTRHSLLCVGLTLVLFLMTLINFFSLAKDNDYGFGGNDETSWSQKEAAEENAAKQEEIAEKEADL